LILPTIRSFLNRRRHSKYDLRGVSSGKEEVHAAIKALDKGVFPKAFCKILPDITGSNPDWCNILHSDGAGTKSSLAYMYWKETGDLSVWKGIAQDAVVMNLDDLACVGALDNILISSTIGRNKHLIPGEVVTEIIRGTEEFLEKLRELGIGIRLAGGETADIGDLVRTVVVDSSVFCRIPRSQVIDNAHIAAGDVIIGLASSGIATYETDYNSGIGSNGLTAARHDVLDKSYATRYPESYDNQIPDHLLYTGSRELTNPSDVKGMTVGRMLLSPTRTYTPVLKHILDEFREEVHGIVHCTGGGQTKILHFIDRVKVIKDNLFPMPPVFRMIHAESRTPWKEMYQVFNMGHRMELVVSPCAAPRIINIATQFNIPAQVVGHVEASAKSGLTIFSSEGTFHY